MLIRNFSRLVPYKNFFVNRIKIRCCSTKAEQPGPKEQQYSSSRPPEHKIHVSNFDRRLLVMLKYYDSLDKVPRAISADTLGRARSQMRIRVSNILMVLTLIMCFIAAWWGKKRAQRGETLSKMMNERDMKLIEDYKREQEALKQKSL